MIDTVVLTIPRDKVVMVDMSYHGVQPWDLHSKGKGFEKYVKNPSERDLENDMYLPRLTGWKRQGLQQIKIEFSAPKLLYKNNLDELSDSEFPKIITILMGRLERMGVRVQKNVLEEANVSAVHYSRNIELKGYTAQYVIGEIAKINVVKSFDFARARFMNDGQSIYIHSTTHEVTIYDKIADLIKGSKRSIDRDQTDYQQSLFGQLCKRKEIIRIEVRLNKKRKIKSLFESLDITDNLVFRNIFSEAKSKKVVEHYWKTMVEANTTIFLHSLTSKDILKQIMLMRPCMKPNRAIYLAGLITLSRDGNGMREMRAIVTKNSNDRTWYRICADYKDVAVLLSSFRLRDWFDQVRKALRKYEPFHIEGG